MTNAERGARNAEQLAAVPGAVESARSTDLFLVPSSALRVSVVVPTYRRPDLLDRCLAALVAQDLDPAAYEVLIADDAGCAETERLVACWARRSQAAVRYVRTPAVRRPGPAAARNRGWRAARGGIVAFTDDDCLPDRTWLRAGLAAFDGACPCGCRVGQRGEGSGPVMGVWGRIVMPLPPVPTDYERNAAGLEQAEAATANCFYRREALAAAGGFDERFAMAWREDADLYLTLLERGARVVHAPNAVVVHPVRPAPWGISLRQQHKSEFNALLYKKHPALYWRRIQPSPPWHYYRIVAALLATAAGVLVRRRGLALLGASAWLTMTARFCATRLRGTSRAPSHVAEMVVTSALIPPVTVYWRLRGAVRFRVPVL